MKTVRPLLYVTAVMLLLVCPVVFYYPIHDLFGLWNTNYSSKFSPNRFAQVTVGMSRSSVVELLGAPLQTDTITNYPVWALRDEGVRRHYGTNAQLHIESLTFSQAKQTRDYDLVCVWIDPDNKVIEHWRGVTD